MSEIHLKLRHHSNIVHYLAADFPDEDWGWSNRNKRQPTWRSWALCGGSGTRRLKPTNLPVTCKSCLSIAEKIRNGTHKYIR